MKVLEVRIDEVTMDEARARVAGFLQEKKLHKIFTPNPEMLVAATKNPKFCSVLNTADLSLCDGKGVELFSRGKLKRIPGVDFMVEILSLAERENQSVFLLGSAETKVVKKLFDHIQEKFPKLRVAGMHPGAHFVIHKGDIVYRSKEEEEINRKVLEDIEMSKADIVFVAFGHEKQEIWIDEYAHDLKTVKIAMGVGGAFEYLSGAVSRAPQWLRIAGFEWLYRVCTQPKRIGRIFVATILFPYYALTKNR